MKLLTHYVFSIGVITLLLSLFTSFYNVVVVAVVVSLIGNTVIDSLGHKEVVTRYGEIPVRTPLTHTFPRSVIWGLISSLPVLFIALLSGHYYYYHYYLNNYEFIQLVISVLVSGVLVGPTHMLLDVFTEKGIYVKKHGKWKRFALAHFRYNNPLANGLAIVIGFALLYLSYML